MDELLAEMNNCKHVKQGSTSLKGYATMILHLSMIWKTMAVPCWNSQRLRSSCLSFYQSLIQETTQTLEERCIEQERKKMCQTS